MKKDFDLQVRPLCVSDLPALLKIEAACYQRPWSRAQFLEELNNPIASIDVVCTAEEIAGYHCFWVIAGEMQILNLATAPAFRRQGVAAKLIMHAINKHADDLEKIWLEVRASNHSAITLYKKLGFTVEGTRTGYYHDGEDAWLMCRQFENAKVRSAE